MKITFYHSALCPRCLLVGRTLKKLQQQFPDLVVEKVEVTLRPVESLRNGISMIPALIDHGRKLSGLILTEAMVREFVVKGYEEQAGRYM